MKMPRKKIALQQRSEWTLPLCGYCFYYYYYMYYYICFLPWMV